MEPGKEENRWASHWGATRGGADLDGFVLARKWGRIKGGSRLQGVDRKVGGRLGGTR